MTGLMGSFSGRIKRGTKSFSVVGEYWEMWARRPQGQVQFNTEGNLKQGCWPELEDKLLPWIREMHSVDPLF